MLTTIIPSYLYQQYYDDSDLQGFVSAYNTLAQEYLDWFNTLDLPIYTAQYGASLDWVALGLYGIVRPTLAQGSYIRLGEYDSVPYDTLPYDAEKLIPPSEFYITTDDIFKRIITWNFYKGDGYQFNITWLKKRIQRFLQGTDGTLAVLDNTYQVSVTFDPGNVVNINIASGGLTQFAPIMESAINSGALELPFQYTYNVTY
jgi:hypothetical protein